MTTGGWILMSVSLSVVWLGACWCYWRVLNSPRR